VRQIEIAKRAWRSESLIKRIKTYKDSDIKWYKY
jgi:hypothetical protein